MGCINIMTYERWNNLYQEAMNILEIIGNACPFVNDDSVDCNCCKLKNKCNYVIGIHILQPK